MMHITIDGIIYQYQAHGGISRIYNEVLPRICQLEPLAQIDLYADFKQLRQPLPKDQRIRHHHLPPAERWLRPWRLFRPLHPLANHLSRRYAFGSGRGRVWQSTFYTRPEGWQGRQAALVADLAQERFPELFNHPDDEQIRQQKRLAVEAADLVQCISAATGKDVEDYYGIPANRIRVTPLAGGMNFGVDAEAGRRARAKHALAGPFIMYVGDRNHYKNFQGLLEAFGAWASRSEYKLVVVGRPDWSAAEESTITRLGVRPDIHNLGRVDDHILRGLYNAAAAFVYPSLYEGFGIPVLEAMACGCPVLASRIPTNLEVGGDVPLFFNPTDRESFVSALDSIIGEGRASERAQRGLAHAATFSWERTARKTLAVFRELASSTKV